MHQGLNEKKEMHIHYNRPQKLLLIFENKFTPGAYLKPLFKFLDLKSAEIWKLPIFFKMNLFWSIFWTPEIYSASEVLRIPTRRGQKYVSPLICSMKISRREKIIKIYLHSKIIATNNKLRKLQWNQVVRERKLLFIINYIYNFYKQNNNWGV